MFKFNTKKDSISNKYVKIKGITSLIDQEIFLDQEIEYGTDEIHGVDSSNEWKIADVSSGKITVEFKHTIFYLEVKYGHLGDKTFIGEITFDLLTGEQGFSLETVILVAIPLGLSRTHCIFNFMRLQVGIPFSNFNRAMA